MREALLAAAEVGEVAAEHGERPNLRLACADARASASACSQIGSDSSWRQATINAPASAASAYARSGEGGSAGTSSTARSNAARAASALPLS